MEVSSQDDNPVGYKSPKRVQVWFLWRSRRKWKQKYLELKAQAKRLQNRAADVTKSREKWRLEVQQQRERLQQLEAENTRLNDQLQGKKKRRTSLEP